MAKTTTRCVDGRQACSIIRPLAVEPKETLSVSVDRSLLATLDEYCECLESPRAYVVQQMIAHVIAKDPKFAFWRAAKEQQAAAPAATKAAAQNGSRT
jgi:hypothetical protein